MTYGVQLLAKTLGDAGCYFLSLLKIAEDYSAVFLDPIGEASDAIKAGTMGQDCFVNDAASILSAVTRMRFEVLKAGPGHELPLDYNPGLGEREILRFERNDPSSGKPLAHFVVGNGRGQVSWDPWPDSYTVAHGVLVSKRIIRRKA